jgi:hypothetical protein
VEKATHQSNVSVNNLDSAIGLWHQEFGMDDLLDSENYTVLDTQSNGGPIINPVLENFGTYNACTNPEFSTALLAYST